MTISSRPATPSGTSIRTCLAACILVIAAVLSAAQLGPACAQGNPWGKNYIPNFEVVNQNGKRLRFYDDLIHGKIVVISFIYTTCRDICPLVTARLSHVYERLGDIAGRDIHFVSVSIDPENDTPERLKEHTEAFKTAADWQFVTGDTAEIQAIRYKLGERSRILGEHKNEIVMFNDHTGEWSRDSAFTDLNVLATVIRSMDPAYRNAAPQTASAPSTATSATEAVIGPGQVLFVKTCGACHTVGKGARVGPDLSGVMQRRDRAWIKRYITEPDRVRAEKDPIAMELRQVYKAVRMPNLGLSEGDTADILAYLDSHATPTKPIEASGRPAGPADIQHRH